MHRQVHIHIHGSETLDILLSVNGVAVSSKICSISSTVKFAFTWRSNAATADTAGPAIDVPFHPPSYPLPGTDERIFTPGAEISGLISSYGDGPRREKLAYFIINIRCTCCK